jgi:hypothetical protein
MSVELNLIALLSRHIPSFKIPPKVKCAQAIEIFHHTQIYFRH